ncbi:hypothetical protein PoB_006101600 [Plakobranchus ocellatus]|uniref:Uncharacterized protein n=1 Tax=Plakobranchus ocellatus TaxID=259542 RepID=A0AAV4CRI9_9GAST|nr:hypothetical protein PoB_006101600 [Plakobranchus ocellatus]
MTTAGRIMRDHIMPPHPQPLFSLIQQSDRPGFIIQSKALALQQDGSRSRLGVLLDQGNFSVFKHVWLTQNLLPPVCSQPKPHIKRMIIAVSNQKRQKSDSRCYKIPVKRCNCMGTFKVKVCIKDFR